MNKQIEEMREDISSADQEYRQLCEGRKCRECFYFSADMVCESQFIAEKLHAKGYRKASEVAREIFAEIEKRISTLEYQANTPRKTVKTEELKAQVNWILHEVVPQTIAELKKKYEVTEDEQSTMESNI